LKLFDCSHCGLNGNIQFEFFEYIAIEKNGKLIKLVNIVYSEAGPKDRG